MVSMVRVNLKSEAPMMTGESQGMLPVRSSNFTGFFARLLAWRSASGKVTRGCFPNQAMGTCMVSFTLRFIPDRSE
jgi:hypothetical protein